MVPEPAWTLLKSWYGSYDVEFPRKVILRGFTESIEIHPQPCVLRVCGADGEAVQESQTVLVSRTSTGPQLLVELQTAKSIPSDTTCRLWIKVCRVFGLHVHEWLSRRWMQPSIGDDYVLVDPSTPLDELAANDDVSTFLLETQSADGTWPRSGASATAAGDSTFVIPPGPVTDVVAWRAALKVGDYLDTQDHQNKWYDSRVAEVVPAFSDATHLPVEFRHKAEESIRIHFMGWEARFDMWYLRSSPKLQPLYTKVRNWRDFRVNDKIEMRVSGKWYVVKVEEVDRPGTRIRLQPVDKAQRLSLGDRWFDFLSDDIAAAKTHVKSYDFDDMYSTATSSYYSRGNTRGSPSAPGVCGLNNLGACGR